MSLPQGYDTMVGENASLVSGGQAKRLQIARALARPSKILILDECTLALDPSNQTAVLEVRHARAGRTAVMVMHKLSVMRMCGRILVLHDGEVAEHGTCDSVVEKGVCNTCQLWRIGRRVILPGLFLSFLWTFLAFLHHLQPTFTHSIFKSSTHAFTLLYHHLFGVLPVIHHTMYLLVRNRNISLQRE